MSSWLPIDDGSAFAFGSTELTFLLLFVMVILLVPGHAIFTRFISVLALCAVTYKLEEAFFRLCNNPHWRGFIAPMLCIQLMSASELILISRVESAPISTNSASSIVTRAARTIDLLWNLRRIGTRWQVKNVPIALPSTRAEFVRRRLITTAIAYLILDVIISGPPPPSALFGPEKRTLFQIGSLSQEDIVFRIIGTASYWFSAFLTILIVFNVTAIAFVLTGLSSPKNCPPFFGSIKDAYTMRHFWGYAARDSYGCTADKIIYRNLWHQCLRRGLSGHADLVADSILQIPRDTLLSRYTRIFGAFLISGLIHHVNDVAMGVRSADAGSICFYPVQALGIMVEDGIQALTRRLHVSSSVRRLVGYAWVGVFLAWSTPTLFYPQLRVGTDPGLLLPIHVVRPLIDHVKGVWQV